MSATAGKKAHVTVELAYSGLARGGSSDKVYNVHLVEDPPGVFHVVGENGRRGSRLTTQRVADNLTSFAAAEIDLDKKVASKRHHRMTPYTVVCDSRRGAPPQSMSNNLAASRPPAAEARVGFIPAIPTSIDRAEAERLLGDEDWFMEEKRDGVRVVGRLTNHARAEVSWGNKLGRRIPDPGYDLTRELMRVAEIAGSLAGLALDGELVGGRWHVFDVVERRGVWLSDMNYEMRLAIRDGLPARHANDLIVRCMDESESPISFVRAARTAAEKRELFWKIEAGGGEGVVFKRLDGEYSLGRGRQTLKFKFTEDVTVIAVPNRGARTCRCYLYAATDAAATAPLLHVGDVTVPSDDLHRRLLARAEANEPIIADVRYRHISGEPGSGGKLIEPVWKGTRDDVEMKECTAAGLRRAGGRTGAAA